MFVPPDLDDEPAEKLIERIKAKGSSQAPEASHGTPAPNGARKQATLAADL